MIHAISILVITNLLVNKLIFPAYIRKGMNLRSYSRDDLPDLVNLEKQAFGEIQKGKPFLVFDDEKREGETDMMLPSQFMTPDIVRKMRREGGGLICLSLREKDAVRIGLPYLETILPQTGIMKGLFRNDDLKYDSSSAFSLTINTRNSFTGITDIDRSSTIREFASFLSDLGRFNGTASSIFADRPTRIRQHLHHGN